MLRAAGWLERFDWQYHWHNPGYADFDDFLAGLRHKPRKNIRAERRRVHEAGWRFRWRDGSTLSAPELDFLDRCYRSTFAVYGNWPSLNRDFFGLNAQRFGAQFLVCIAELNGQDLACAIFWRIFGTRSPSNSGGGSQRLTASPIFGALSSFILPTLPREVGARRSVDIRKAEQ